MSNTQICEHCEGGGIAPNPFESTNDPCLHCNGTGTIPPAYIVSPNEQQIEKHPSATIHIECPLCNTLHPHIPDAIGEQHKCELSKKDYYISGKLPKIVTLEKSEGVHSNKEIAIKRLDHI